MFTELKDRTLWYDGTNLVPPDFVPSLFLLGINQDNIVVTELNEDIILFNQLSDSEISVGKEKNKDFDFSWNIPEKYKQINLENYLLKILSDRNLSEDYIHRVALEFIEVDKYSLHNLFRTLIFIIDTLKEKKQIWGVGRGSSSASLILHLIGLHEVDPVKYKIPLEEFFHD